MGRFPVHPAFLVLAALAFPTFFVLGHKHLVAQSLLYAAIQVTVGIVLVSLLSLLAAFSPPGLWVTRKAAQVWVAWQARRYNVPNPHTCGVCGCHDRLCPSCHRARPTLSDPVGLGG
jgi:hypothetical protein